MATKKRKSAASRQRARARQQQQRAAASAPQGQDPGQGQRDQQTQDGPQGQGSQPRPRGQQAQGGKQAGGPSGGRRPGGRGPKGRRRRSSRTPWLLVGGVVVVVGVFVVLFLTRGDDTGRGKASSGSIDKLTSVPVATLETVGVPPAPSNVNVLPPGTPPLEENGKPVVLYIGAEYCPFCALERWPMVVALSRFGTFSGLESTTSAPPPETLPNTPTVTFAGSTYTSDLITFSSAETQTRDFSPLQTLTPTQQQLIETYDVEAITGSNGAIPFVMIGNLYAWAGSQFEPSTLDGLTFDQIANQLSDPKTAVAQQIGGAANYITAMICQLTEGQPSDVCSSAVIQQAQAALPTS